MKLQEYLEKYNLNQGTFARSSGLSEPMVSRIINKKDYSPRIDAIKKIVEFTQGKVSYEDFLNAA